MKDRIMLISILCLTYIVTILLAIYYKTPSEAILSTITFILGGIVGFLNNGNKGENNGQK